MHRPRKEIIREAVKSYLIKHDQPEIKPKAVLFDMDGVLYDSMRFHAKAWKEVADLYNIPSQREEFYLFEGRTGGSTIDILFQRTYGRSATEQEKREIYQKKSTLFNSYNDGKAMSGTSEVLIKTKEYNLQTLVVTGSGQQALINKLNQTYPGYFDRNKMVTAEDVKYGKPDPEPYLMGLNKAKVNANEAIVIENAPLGVQAGVAAGIFTIAVNTGPLDNSILLNAGADLLFPSMSALAMEWDIIMNVMKPTRNI